MKTVQTPQFLNHLYRDLRDRRLLLPAAVLLVALIAVPLAFSSSSPTAVPPPPVPAATAGGSEQEAATVPAVLTEELGVTDYQKRLERLQSKNPFQRQFTAVPKSTTSETSASAGTSSASTSDTGLPPTSSSTAPLLTPTSSSTSPSSPTSSVPSSEPPEETPQTTTEVIQRRIDVKVGLQGELVKKTGVKQLRMLPSSATPVVVFLGTNESGGRAFFLVSSDVTAVTGDGACLTITPTCQFLTLKPDEAASFDYAPDALTYKLRLLAIKDVVVKKTHG